MDVAQRQIWLPGAELHLRTATPHKSARYDWEEGATRVMSASRSWARSKSRIGIMHERLPDSDTADEMKTSWPERVAALKPLLEGGGLDA